MNVARTLAVGALVALFSLFAASDANAQDAPRSRDSQSILIVVQNNGYYDQHVYAVQGGQRRTIGFVTGLTTQTLSLPRAMAEAERDIQVFADPVAGGGAYLSPVLMVSPGDQVNVTLHTDATYSSATVSDREADDPETPDSSPIHSD